MNFIKYAFLFCFVSHLGQSAIAREGPETGVTDSTIKIGMSAPLTGSIGAYGTEMRSVIELYFQEVNAAGGVNGRTLELVSKDDGYETTRAVENTKQLIEQDKVFALTGYYGSSPTIAAMEVFSAAKVPLVGAISGSDALRTPVNRYMFHVRASYANETDQIIKQLMTIGLTKIGVLYQNDGFGKSGLEGITAAMKKNNLVPAVVASVERNSTDVSAAIKAMSEVKLQAVVLVALYKPVATFVKQLKEAKLFPYIATLSPVGADNLVRELNGASRGIMISQVMPYPSDDTKQVARDYKRLIEKAGRKGQESYYGIEGYIDARVLVEGIKLAGRNLTREKLVASLENMHNFNVGGFPINYLPTNHNGSQFVEITILGPGGKLIR